MRATTKFWIFPVVACFFFFQTSSHASFPKDNHVDDVQPMLVKYADVHKEKLSSELRGKQDWKASDKMMDYYLQRQQRNLDDKIITTLTCDVCHLLVKVARGLIHSGKTQEVVAEAVTEICILFRIQDKRVCKMITHQYKVGLWGKVVYSLIDCTSQQTQSTICC